MAEAAFKAGHGAGEDGGSAVQACLNSLEAPPDGATLSPRYATDPLADALSRVLTLLRARTGIPPRGAPTHRPALPLPFRSGAQRPSPSPSMHNGRRNPSDGRAEAGSAGPSVLPLRQRPAKPDLPD